MSVLFLLASLGAINGALVAFYLIGKRQATITDRYFGWLILALSIRIGKSVFFYFENDPDRLILQIGLSACMFIGPFFYLYAKALLKNDRSYRRSDLFLLLVLLLLILTVGSICPYRIHPEVWNTYIVKGIYFVWLVFTLMGIYYVAKLFGSDRTKTARDQTYIFAVTMAMVFITATYQFALFIKGFTYIWGAVIFSLSFYYLLTRALLKNTSIAPKNISAPLKNGTQLLAVVDNWMKEQKPFTNQKLKLDELASQVDMTKHLLSRVLNEEYPFGFSQYVKEYRVKEAKGLIATRPELSLEGIGYEAGFSSKSAFFEAFKKVVGCTPAEYKKTL